MQKNTIPVTFESRLEEGVVSTDAHLDLDTGRREPVKFVSAVEFAKTHACDPDWLSAMGSNTVPIFKQGQRGTTSGFAATVVRHTADGMYEVRVPGGVKCISWQEFDFDGNMTMDAQNETSTADGAETTEQPSG